MSVAILMAAAFVGWSATGVEGATTKNTCFSESASPDRRIAACTALIRSPLPTAKAARASKGVSSDVAAEALLSRAGAFGQKGDFRHAIDDATRVIAIAPSGVAYYTRALAYHNAGEDMQAIADCDAALRIDPNNANAFFVCGAAHHGLAAYDEAIRDLTKVLELEPKRVDALFLRGASHFSAGEFDDAVEDLSRAMALGAKDGIVFYLRALAYQGLGDQAKSRADMAEAVRRNPDLARKPSGPSTTGQR